MGYHDDLTGNTATARVDRHALSLPIKWWTKVERQGNQYAVNVICRFNDAQNQSSENVEFKFAFERDRLAKPLKGDQGVVFRLINQLSAIKQQIEARKQNVNRMLLEVEYVDPRALKASLENYYRAVERMKKVDCYTELQKIARDLAFLEMINGCHSRDELHKLCTSDT